MLAKRIRVIAAGFMTVVLLAAAPGLAAAKDNNDNNGGDNNPHNQVTLCHATGQPNTFVEITVNANGAVSGHSNHSKDIIPPFTYNDNGTDKNFPGQNWTAEGQAILNNHCVAVGGQGGGGQVVNNTTNINNQSTNVTTAPSGQAAAAKPQVQVTPQGGVAAGEGGGKAYQPAALVGLIGSLGAITSGVALFKRF